MGKEATVIKVNILLKKCLKDNIKAILKLNPVLVLRYTRQTPTLSYNNYISVSLCIPLKKFYVQC